jgi:hypothetical protein
MRRGSLFGHHRGSLSWLWSLRGAIALCLVASVMALSLIGFARGDQPAAQARDKARMEAQKWKPDAELVAIEFFGFSFATDPTTHVPDMTKSGPPGAIMFSFFSASAKDGIRVSVNMQEIPEATKQMMAQRGWNPLQVEHFQSPWSPYTLPIPDSVDLNYQKAIETAKRDIAEQCQGDKYGGCQIVGGMELHMFWNGQGDRTGKPVWTIKFGQDPKTLLSVEREVDAVKGEVIAFDPRKPDEQQSALFSGDKPKQLRNVSVTTTQPGFKGLWRAVNAAVRQQDPLYQPYAVSLAANVRSQVPGDFVRIGEMYIQYGRLTPSLVWDDMTVHVEGRGTTLNVIFEEPQRKQAPLQAKPTALDPDKLPDADPTLRQLASLFPKGYTEIYYSDYQGCQSTTIGNVIKQDCGVWMQQEHRTDVVFFWLTRQGNPSWSAQNNPIASELAMVSERAPPGEWVWWTRSKQANTWKYTVVDAETGKTLPNLCTNPNSGQNQIRAYPC